MFYKTAKKVSLFYLQEVVGVITKLTRHRRRTAKFLLHHYVNVLAAYELMVLKQFEALFPTHRASPDRISSGSNFASFNSDTHTRIYLILFHILNIWWRLEWYLSAWDGIISDRYSCKLFIVDERDMKTASDGAELTSSTGERVCWLDVHWIYIKISHGVDIKRMRYNYSLDYCQR